MDRVTREQYKQLRQKGFTQNEIRDLANRGRIAETLNKQTFAQKGLLRSAGEFLGMDEFGRGIGQTIANKMGAQEGVIQSLEQGSQIQTDLIRRIKQKEKRGEDTTRLKEALAQLGGDLAATGEQVTELGTGGLSSREVIGSAIQTGLSTASLVGFAPKAATGKAIAAKNAARAAQGVDELGRAGRIGVGIVQGAKTGALGGAMFGGAEGLTEGTGIVPGAAKGAALGGAVGGVFGGVSQYIDDLTKVTPESRLLETKDEFKTLKRKFNENTIKRNGEIVSDPISTIQDEGIMPDIANSIRDGKIRTETARAKIREIIAAQADEVDTAVATAMQQGGNPQTIAELKRQALEAVKNNPDFKARGVVQKTQNEVSRLFDDFALSYGDELTVNNTNAIREAMNRVYNPDTIDAERAIGDVMRKHVYQSAPGSQQALAREGQLIGADKFLDALDGKTVKGGRLGKYFANLVGAMVGQQGETPFGLGPVVGALGGGKVAEFMQAQQLNPIAPKMARGIVSLVNQLPTDASGNISRTAVLNLIGQLSGQSDSQ